MKALCSQTENGLSVRALMTLPGFVKALAWFRGQAEVALSDVRNLVPWILHEKLVQNATSPFFDESRNGVYRVDRVAWIRRAFDLACEEYVRLDLDRDDPVARIESAGYTGWIGLEYKPAGKTEDGLGWIKAACGCGCKS